MPLLFKIDFYTELNTTLITVSLRPIWFPRYFTLFRQTRRRDSLSLKQVVIDWLFTLLEARIAGKNSPLSSKKHSKRHGFAKTYDETVSPAKSARDSPGSLKVYRQVMAMLGKAMEIRQLSVQGKIGLDDACQTALLCGSLTVIGGMLGSNPRRSKSWRVAFSPVYHREYFALKVNTVVRLSLLNAFRLMFFVKYVMQ